MNLTILAVFLVFGLLDFISIVTEIFGRRTAGGDDPKEAKLLQRRRILLHLGVYALIIGGFWAIIHFGPLRPVHEWLR
jgi:hypothetical protein